MAVARKPKPQEKEIIRVIEKGGSPPAKPQKKEVKLVQLRLSSTILKQIDSAREDSLVPVSRHHWIMEAIASKLKNTSS